MATKRGGDSSDENEDWSPNFNTTTASSSDEVLNRVPSVKMRRKVRKKKRRRLPGDVGRRTERETTEETEEMSIEVEVHQLHGNLNLPRRTTGGTTVNIDRPVMIMDLPGSVDVILNTISQHMNIPRSTLDQAFSHVPTTTEEEREDENYRVTQQNHTSIGNVKDTIASVLRSNVQDNQQEQNQKKLSTTAAAYDNVALVTADGAQQTRTENIVQSGRITDKEQEQEKDKKFDNAIEMEEIDLKDHVDGKQQQQQQQQQQPKVQVEVGQTEDGHGNVKYTFKIRRHMTHKVEKVIDEGWHVMAKACSLTVVCSVFLIIAWIILDQAKIKWFTT